MIGRGRWTIKRHILRDLAFRKFAIAEGHYALNRAKEAREGRTKSVNPQKVYLDWKLKVMKKARDREKEIVPKFIKEKIELQRTLSRLRETTDMDEKCCQIEMNIVSGKIEALERRNHLHTRDKIAIQGRGRYQIAE